jgi:hypothetical protein
MLHLRVLCFLRWGGFAGLRRWGVAYVCVCVCVCCVCEQSYLLFGKGGWICGILAELLTQQGKTFKIAESRMENRESVARCVACLFGVAALDTVIDIRV